MRRHGDSCNHLHRAIIGPGDKTDRKTIQTWATGVKAPGTIESLSVLKRIERRYRLPEGYFQAKLDRSGRAALRRLGAENTFEVIANKYIDEKMVPEGRAEATLRKARWFLELLKPAIGNMAINDVDPQLMLAALKKLEAKGNLETAKKCRSFARRVFRYGAALGQCQSPENGKALPDPARRACLMKVGRPFAARPLPPSAACRASPSTELLESGH